MTNFKTSFVCPHCGKDFEDYTSYVKIRGRKWCSKECAYKGRTAKPRVCIQCNETFQPPNPGWVGMGKYCSRGCYYAALNAKKLAPIEIVCATCGVSFTRPRAWVKKTGVRTTKYCSIPCKNKARIRPGSTSSRGSGWRTIRIAIRERDGYLCVRCGQPDDTKLLAVDHIIPWILVSANEELANHSDNLASLCLSCHGLKTASVEPRLLKGDILSVIEFYGPERSDRAFKNWSKI